MGSSASRLLRCGFDSGTPDGLQEPLPQDRPQSPYDRAIQRSLATLAEILRRLVDDFQDDLGLVGRPDLRQEGVELRPEARIPVAARAEGLQRLPATYPPIRELVEKGYVYSPAGRFRRGRRDRGDARREDVRGDRHRRDVPADRRVHAQGTTATPTRWPHAEHDPARDQPEAPQREVRRPRSPRPARSSCPCCPPRRRLSATTTSSRPRFPRKKSAATSTTSSACPSGASASRSRTRLDTVCRPPCRRATRSSASGWASRRTCASRRRSRSSIASSTTRRSRRSSSRSSTPSSNPRGRSSTATPGTTRPLLWDGVSFRELARGGMILGPNPTSQYERGYDTLAPDSVLLAYTDGIVEAVNASDEAFGMDRLARGHPRARVAVRPASSSTPCSRRCAGTSAGTRGTTTRPSSRCSGRRRRPVRGRNPASLRSAGTRLPQSAMRIPLAVSMCRATAGTGRRRAPVTPATDRPTIRAIVVDEYASGDEGERARALLGGRHHDRKEEHARVETDDQCEGNRPLPRVLANPRVVGMVVQVVAPLGSLADRRNDRSRLGRGAGRPRDGSGRPSARPTARTPHRSDEQQAASALEPFSDRARSRLRRGATPGVPRRSTAARGRTAENPDTAAVVRADHPRARPTSTNGSQ